MVTGVWLLCASESIQMLMVHGATHEASWLSFSSFLVVCLCNLQPGKADHRFAGAPGNALHNPFNMRSLALFTFYKWILKSLLELGEEVMQKELVLCNGFFSWGIIDSKQKARYKVGQRPKAVYLKRPSLKIKFGFHSHAENVSWYFIHLFTQPLHPHLDSRWE